MYGYRKASPVIMYDFNEMSQIGTFVRQVGFHTASIVFFNLAGGNIHCVLCDKPMSETSARVGVVMPDSAEMQMAMCCDKCASQYSDFVAAGHMIVEKISDGVDYLLISDEDYRKKQEESKE